MCVAQRSRMQDLSPTVSRECASAAGAARWFRAAAVQGEARAQFNLGLMYARGLGVENDPVRALMWMQLADAILSAPANQDAAETRQIVMAALGPEQIARVTEMAERCRASDYQDCD